MRKLVLVLVAIATFSCSKDDDCPTITDKFTRGESFVIELDGWEERYVQQFKYNDYKVGQQYCN